MSNSENRIAGRRPVIVIKSSFLEKLVTVIPCSTKLTNVEFGKVEIVYNGEDEDIISYPVFNQITTVNAWELETLIGKLSPEKAREVQNTMIKFLCEPDELDIERFPVERILKKGWL